MNSVTMRNYLSEMFDGNNENIVVANEGIETQEAELTSKDEWILASLERGIEQEINKTLDEEIPQGTISEGASEGGFAYERAVLSAIRKAGLTGKILTGAGANAAAADADIKINGQIFNIEVKLNNDAQMGGSSVRFGKGPITLVKSVEKETEELLKAAVANESKKLSQLIAFISSRTPRSVNKSAIGFPLSCTTEAWGAAQKKGLLINIKIKHSAEFIAKHYAKKGIFYIQIGGAGLFYLAGNPANLPIPQLTGDVNIEIRSARSGSKTLASGIQVIGGGIRVQARLKTKGKSPYTADDPKSLLKMIHDMKFPATSKKKSPAAK